MRYSVLAPAHLRLLCIAAFVSIAAMSANDALAQAGLRASLERLDTNQDGEIQPSEITPLSRPYLERIGKAHRLSTLKSNRIDKWQEAARVYHAFQNGVRSERVTIDPGMVLKGFEPEKDEPLVPEFGVAKIKFRYTQEDLDEADQTLRRCDKDGDGYIDRAESEQEKWTHRNPFDEDFDGDNRLSRMELAQRYARRRLLDSTNDELLQKVRRVGNGIEPAARKTTSQITRRSSSDRSGHGHLTTTLLGRFDLNRNGRLDEAEAAPLRIPRSRIDTDRNGELTSQEISDFFAGQQELMGDSSETVPGWFQELDTNRDNQVAMIEFSEVWSEEKAAEFDLYDGNGDGMLTAYEVIHSNALSGGTFSNTTAEVLPPRKTVISEIDIADDFVIGDLNLQLSITHTHSAYLDAYITAPDGTRVMLFEAIGGSGDHFERTTIDDQSGFPIAKARSPFTGTFQPHALMKRQPGLAAFNDKPSKGVWQLVVRCSRSDRFGMLHNWKLMITPKTDVIGGVPAVAKDGPQQAARLGQNDGRDGGREKDAAKQAWKGQMQDVERRLEQSKEWTRDIKARLSQKDLSEGEKRALTSKMERIEKYRDMLRKQSGGTGKEENQRRKEEKQREKDQRKSMKR